MKRNRREILVGGLGATLTAAMATKTQAAADAKKSISPDLITLVAEIQAKPGEEAAVREALIAMVGPTRKEPGCLCYNLHESKKQPGSFMFYEQWKNKAALDAHGKSAHMSAMRTAIRGKTAKGGANRWQQIA